MTERFTELVVIIALTGAGVKTTAQSRNPNLTGPFGRPSVETC